MPRNFKARKSYHGDAATLLKLAEVIASDAAVPASRGQAVCQKLTELANDLAGLKPYAVPSDNNVPANPKTGESKRATVPAPPR